MRRFLLSCTTLILAGLAACGDTGSNATRTPELPADRTPASLTAASCELSAAEVRALLAVAFANTPDENSVVNKWDVIIQKYTSGNAGEVQDAKDKTFQLVEFILRKRAQKGLNPSFSDEDFAYLLEQMYCNIGEFLDVGDPDDLWLVPVGNSLTTFITQDKLSGIQFQSNAVSVNTIVTAVRRDETALQTLLDKYPFVYDWSLAPSQTLLTPATVGVCPDPALIEAAPEPNKQALLDRLVLGHQNATNGFDVLARVPIPTAMVLDCGEINDGTTSASTGSRMLEFLGELFLPTEVHAARALLRTGGIGGSTSEFSSFGPVDKRLNLTGGVGGSTSEFSRADALLVASLSEDPATIDGTVGTQRSDALLPFITVATDKGTVIPGIGTLFTTGAPATTTPVGNATVCGSNTQTDVTGTSRVTCLDFGTTTQFATAFTKLTVSLTLPEGLDAVDSEGEPVVQFAPTTQNWLIASYGPSTLVFTAPPAGRTVANNAPYTADQTIPATVEIRSALGVKVPIATNTVTIAPNKATFQGGAATMAAAAVAGVANLSTRITTADLGYQLTASATLAGTAATATSNSFDVVAGAATQIAAVGTQNYGSTLVNPVTPNPTVEVKDAYGNIAPSTSVFWSAGGATGSAVTPPENLTGTNGQASATWTLGEGDNLLRAALQAAAGEPEVIFSATRPNDDQVLQACAPGGGKDDIAGYYFTVQQPNNRTITALGLYLSAAGAVGQISPTDRFPMQIRVTRVATGEVFTSSANALLRGDNGASNAEQRLVTFNNLNIPTAANNAGRQLRVEFVIPAGGYNRKISFNGGPCGLGRCSPTPPGCSGLTSYDFPVVANDAIYRRSVAIVVTGR
jgi:hypothetical protein